MSYYCPMTSEETLEDMGEIGQHQTAADMETEPAPNHT